MFGGSIVKNPIFSGINFRLATLALLKKGWLTAESAKNAKFR
jgi:hypothetical protein